MTYSKAGKRERWSYSKTSKREMTYSKTGKREMTYSKSSNSGQLIVIDSTARVRARAREAMRYVPMWSVHE